MTIDISKAVDRFQAAGFHTAIKPVSASPETDGYLTVKGGMPFHVHPDETPGEWELLAKALPDLTIGAAAAEIAPWNIASDDEAQRREQRNRLLAASDWTQLADSPLPDADKARWVKYRRALRDLDMTAQDWPLEPGISNADRGED